MRSFGSDNHSGIHPDVLAAIAEANKDHAPAYGQDPWTARAEEAFRQQFGPQARAFIVFNGTAANVLGLMSAARAPGAVVCADVAHINNDECAAPEGSSGLKLIPVPSQDGKIGPEGLDAYLRLDRVPHQAPPRILSITQPTELGTLYTPQEVRILADMAHRQGLLVHMDGARLTNAAAALDMHLADLTASVGVDVLSFGGTKNGLMGAEAVVILNPDLAEGFDFLRKHTMQLASKMRFLAAQFVAFFENDLWRTNAAHANGIAQQLAAGAAAVPGVSLSRPAQTNAVFAVLPEQAIVNLQQNFYFYVWNPALNEVRWMTSFDTAPRDVEFFLQSLRSEMIT